MQEEFEKKVQERVHTFGIQPSRQVWDDIDAVLSKRKHRRVFIGWWILLGLVVIGGGVLLYEKDNILHNDLNQHPGITNNDSTSNNFANTTPATPAPGKGNTQKEQEKPLENKKKIKQGEQDTNQGEGETKQDSKIVTARSYEKNNNKAMQSNLPGIISSGAAQVQKNDKTPITGLTAGKAQPAGNPTAYTPPAFKEPPPFVPGDTKQINEKPQEVITDAAKQVTATTVTPQEKEAGKNNIPKTIARKTGHQWFFTVSGGTTQTISFGAFNESTDKSLYSAYQNVQALTSPAVFKYDITRPGTGFHVTAGAEYQYNFSSRWRMSAGLQVAYLSNTQKTGELYINPSSFYGGLAGNVYLSVPAQLPSYYQSGPSSVNTVINKTWWVQVPVSFNYVVNPRGKTKLLLNAGLSVAQMFNSKWLIPDARYGKLYYDKSALNKTILSWQAGPLLQLRNQVKLGLSYEESFTTLTKKYISPKLYWQNVSLNIAIPLKAKFKKEKK